MKKAFCIAANTCAIVLMGFLCLGSLVVLGSLDDLVAGGSVPTVYVVAMILVLLVSIAAIIVSALALAKGRNKNALGLTIAAMILLGLIAVLEIIGSVGSDSAATGAVYSILCFVSIGLNITYLCVKEPNPQDTAPQPAPEQAPKNPQSLDEKIAELKHLKELGVLDDAQYDAAIEKLVQSVK